MAALANDRHEAVARAYIRDPSHTGWKAYAVVYPKSRKHTAETGWSQLMKRPEFLARINELKEALSAGAIMSLQEVLAELSKLGRSDMRHYTRILTSDNPALELQNMSPEQTAAISEITVESIKVPGADDDDVRTTLRVRFKLHDKRAALSELRKHYEPLRHEHTGANGAPLPPPAALDPLEVGRSIAFALALAEQARRKQLTIEQKDPPNG